MCYPVYENSSFCKFINSEMFYILIASLKGCFSGLHIPVFTLGNHKFALSALYDNNILENM